MNICGRITKQRQKIKYVQYASWKVISPAAKIPTPCACLASLSIFGWGRDSGFDEPARRAASQKLRKYDARCFIILTEGYFGLRRMLRSGFVHLRRPSHFSNLSSFHSEGYRSGHNEAVLKTVCRQARGFESHTLRHRSENIVLGSFIIKVICKRYEKGGRRIDAIVVFNTKATNIEFVAF